MAAKEEGLTDVLCVLVEHMKDAQKRAYILAENHLALNAGWDEEMLSVEIAKLQAADFDVSLLDFDDKELERLLALDCNVHEDEFDVKAEPQKPTFSKIGDMWLLGRHRLASAAIQRSRRPTPRPWTANAPTPL